MFYNELLTQGVYLLKPLPWHLCHLCSGGLPSLLAARRGWNKHMHSFRCEVCWGCYNLSFGSLPIHSQSLGREINQQPVATRTLQNQSEVRICQLLVSTAQEPSQVRDIQSIMTFVYGRRTQNTTPSYHFYRSLDMTVFSKQYQHALSASNISILTNFYQIFL